MELYNEQVLEVATGLRNKLNTIINSTNLIRRHGSHFKSLDRGQILAEVRTLAQEFGYDLTEWLGNDAPLPPEPVLEEP